MTWVGSRLSAVLSIGMDATTRLLVLANRTADSAELLRQLAARHRRGPIGVTMLAPAVWEVQDPHGGNESARRRLRAAQRYLRAEGIEVSCVIGDPDPMTAFQQEWRRHDYDEIIVSTLPSQLSKWLHIDLPQRIRVAASGVPVTHVIATPEPVQAG
jgi:nucleotide-binding universal stress UspA family protein